MSGELQTIPARHGVATFVPRGRTIKIINTYGKQVVSTWAFSLGAPPEEGDDEDEIGEEEVEEIEEKTKELKQEVEEGEAADKSKGKEKQNEESAGSSKSEEEKQDEESAGPSKSGEENVKEEGRAESEADDPPEQAPDTPENEKTTESTSSDQKKPQKQKRTWASYLPSMPYRSKNSAAARTEGGSGNAKQDVQTEKQNAESSKKWSSYFPTGQSFSSYVPDSQSVISAFQASHYRDPNKSYAEQLYDFSKTPVGAGGIAAATGSGTASSIYAAYNAYAQAHPSKNTQPPMEYLSLPHTRASTHRLVPEVNDTLLTNLRAPIMTLIEDTTPGAHDTLTAACDANFYTTLAVSKPEEHGSCAENLVLALKELNEKAGLKGAKAVGADITVNIAPTPLHLFMNTPISLPSESGSQPEGSGARGVSISVEEPKGKKRGHVRFRADRDIVVVMSACPMDVGSQNGGRCMAANFMVEEGDGDATLEGSVGSLKKGKRAPRKLGAQGGAKKDDTSKSPEKKGEQGDTEKSDTTSSSEQKSQETKTTSMPKPRGGPRKISAVQRSAAEAQEGRKKDAAAAAEKKEEESPKKEEESAAGEEKQAAPKKKPKKLERRGGAATPTAKS